MWILPVEWHCTGGTASLDPPLAPSNHVKWNKFVFKDSVGTLRADLELQTLPTLCHSLGPGCPSPAWLCGGASPIHCTTLPTYVSSSPVDLPKSCSNLGTEQRIDLRYAAQDGVDVWLNEKAWDWHEQWCWAGGTGMILPVGGMLGKAYVCASLLWHMLFITRGKRGNENYSKYYNNL